MTSTAGTYNQTEAYPPFSAALITVIVFLDAGLILGAVTLWRSRTVPLWAALCGLAFPVNDQVGSQGWPYDVACVLWALSWGAAATALVRRHAEGTEPETSTGMHRAPSALEQHR